MLSHAVSCNNMIYIYMYIYIVFLEYGRSHLESKYSAVPTILHYVMHVYIHLQKNICASVHSICSYSPGSCRCKGHVPRAMCLGREGSQAVVGSSGLVWWETRRRRDKTERLA